MKPLEKFEDLEAWQKARRLVHSIYSTTRKDHLNKDFGLTNQIQRAGVSIMSNLAEGFERTSLKDKAHFYNIARASCAEVRSLLYVIQDNFPTHISETKELHHQCQLTGKLITGLHSSTKKRLNSAS